MNHQSILFQILKKKLLSLKKVFNQWYKWITRVYRSNTEERKLTGKDLLIERVYDIIINQWYKWITRVYRFTEERKLTGNRRE